MRPVIASILVYLCVSLCGSHASAAAESTLEPAPLRCEYRVDPLGIGVTSPRFTWILVSSANGQKQTAYQVVAASSEEQLAADRGDLWDSGQVTSDETICVPYAGKHYGKSIRRLESSRVGPHGPSVGLE